MMNTAQGANTTSHLPEQNETLLDGITLRELVHVAKIVIRFVRRWWLAMIVGSVLVGAAGIVAFLTSPKEEEAAFEVRLVPKVSDNPVAAFSRSNVEFFASPEQNFRSIPLIEKTCAEVGLAADTPEAIHEVQGRLRIWQVAHNTFRGSFTSPDPEAALNFLSTHAHNYLQHEIDKTLGVIQSEMDFLAERLASVEGELSASDQALQQFRERHADGLPEQAEQHYNTLRTLQQRKIETEAELEQVALELNLNREKLAGEKIFVESKVISTQRKTPYEDAIVGLNQDIARARAAGMNDNHPQIQKLFTLIDEYERLREEEASVDETETESTRNPIYQSIQDAIYQLEVRETVARKKYEQILKNLERAEAIVANLPELERRYAELTRNYETTADLQSRIFNQYKVTELQLSLERTAAESRYDIITPPSVVYSSQMKKAMLLIAGGLIFGFCLGILWGIAFELKRAIATYV